MIDLLNPKTDADRLATLRSLKCGKVKAGCEEVDSVDDLLSTQELADIAGVSVSFLTRLALEFPHIALGAGSNRLSFKADKALALLKKLGYGKFGDGRYLRSDIAAACRVSARGFNHWLGKQTDLPPFTTLKNRRPAWTSADAEIVISRHEEFLYK